MEKGIKWHDEHKDIIERLHWLNGNNLDNHKIAYDWLLQLYDEWKSQQFELTKLKEENKELIEENEKLLARVKQLEIDRDKCNSDKDKLFLERSTILLKYTEWLEDHEFVVTMNTAKNLVTTFIKAINKLTNK